MASNAAARSFSCDVTVEIVPTNGSCNVRWINTPSTSHLIGNGRQFGHGTVPERPPRSHRLVLGLAAGAAAGAEMTDEVVPGATPPSQQQPGIPVEAVGQHVEDRSYVLARVLPVRAAAIGP